MNLKVFASLSLALAAVSFVGDVQPAHAWKHGVNNRQCRQERRIQNGVNSGSLNRWETKRLQGQERALNRQEQRFRESGNGLSQRERNKLEREQNRISNNIYDQKHDGQTRSNWGNPGNGPNNNNGLFNVNKNQQNQEQRIYNGIQSGELTQKEAHRLENQQERFDAREAEMRQGGLTMQERRSLDNQQDRMSKNIYEQKHDGQDNQPQ